MKRFSSSDSLGSLICPPKEENHCYNKEFQEMLDSSDQEEYSGEELMNMAKKKRLRSDQVKALERNFEVENKLDPERKVKLAQELGLQPRQVAIWFQNRRARWKTKQMEKDYCLLKSNHDALKLNYENLQKHNQALNEKLRELKAKVCRESTESFESVKEESPILGFENIDGLDNRKDSNVQENNDKEWPQLYASLKLEDGSSLHGIIRKEKNLGFNGSTSSNSIMNWFQLSKSEAFPVKMSQSQFEKMEEQSLLFSSEEPCNFLSVDQAPTLHWH